VWGSEFTIKVAHYKVDSAETTAWYVLVVLPFPLEQLGLSETVIGPLRISVVGRKHKRYSKQRKKYFCGGAEESKGGDGDAAATVAHAVKGSDGEEKKDGDGLFRFRTRWCPWELPSFIRAAGPRRRRDATATRLMGL
jgi:hypothetical protein